VSGGLAVKSRVESALVFVLVAVCSGRAEVVLSVLVELRE
jgi:hypothetical protein